MPDKDSNETYFEKRPDLETIRDIVTPIMEEFPSISGLTGISLYGPRATGNPSEGTAYQFVVSVTNNTCPKEEISELNYSLECALGAPVECMTEVDLTESGEYHDGSSGLRWIWGEPIDGELLVFTPERAKKMLTFRVLNVYYTLKMKAEFSDDDGLNVKVDSQYVQDPIFDMTLEHMDKIREIYPDVYSKWFADIIPDMYAIENEMIPELIKRASGLMKELDCKLPKLSYDWDKDSQ